jgi:hypothetical protein
MLLEKIYVVTLKDSTPVDVTFSVEKADVHYDDEHDSNYSYDVAGLSEHQIDELEDFVTANIDAWFEDVMAEYEESQDDEICEWDKDEY